MLKQRIITAVILAVVVIGTIVYGDTHWVSLLFALILFAATRELLMLTVKLPEFARLLFAGVFALLFWWSLALVTPQMIYWKALTGAVLWFLIACALPFYRHSGNWPLLARVLALGLGLDLLWICTHAMVFLHYAHGWQALLFLFTLVWFADIGAYFSGRRFGTNKLAPAISPGKTREGVVGGICANLCWMLLLFYLVEELGLTLIQFLLIGLVTTMVSVVGDLFESILKREAGVKDSGKLLPGHGGVLDRIDSVIAAAPVFVAGVFIASGA